MKIEELENAPQWLLDAETENADVEIIGGHVHWRGGEWHGGDWRGDEWHDGIWHGGTWHGGTWYGGDWYGGEWCDGWFGAGTWHDGIWHDGALGLYWTQENPCSVIWHGGTWHDGIWDCGDWRGGDWRGGKWYRGKWYGRIDNKGMEESLNRVLGIIRGDNDDGEPVDPKDLPPDDLLPF